MNITDKPEVSLSLGCLSAVMDWKQPPNYIWTLSPMARVTDLCKKEHEHVACAWGKAQESQAF